MPRKKRLTKDLVAKGWIPGSTDLCWLACAERGHYHEPVDGKTISLCVDHIRELESTSYKGYHLANPPEGYDDRPEEVLWPWADAEPFVPATSAGQTGGTS